MADVTLRIPTDLNGDVVIVVPDELADLDGVEGSGTHGDPYGIALIDLARHIVAEYDASIVEAEAAANPDPTFYEQIAVAEFLADRDGQPDDIQKLANIARDLAGLVDDLNRELREARANHG